MKIPDAIPASNSTAPARLVVDLDALRHNYSVLQSLAPSARCAAVVKADAYGLDAGRVTGALREAGCTLFFVATPEEGASVRQLLGPSPSIYVLNGFQPGLSEMFARSDLIPVIGSLDSLNAFGEEGGGVYALHVDTGMNRLGLTVEEARSLALPRGGELRLVMSHLACSDVPAHPMNAHQLERFRTVLEHFPGIPASLANTGGVLLGPDYHFDIIRPGVGLYGVNPSATRSEPFRPVFHVDAPILQIRRVAAGETVGYGARFTAAGQRTIAIAGFGYADGLFRAASQTGSARIGEIAVPFAGMVSMDLTALDVTGHEDLARKAGRVQFYGADLGAAADAAGTIGYELLVRLGARLKREYLGR